MVLLTGPTYQCYKNSSIFSPSISFFIILICQHIYPQRLSLHTGGGARRRKQIHHTYITLPLVSGFAFTTLSLAHTFSSLFPPPRNPYTQTTTRIWRCAFIPLVLLCQHIYSQRLPLHPGGDTGQMKQIHPVCTITLPPTVSYPASPLHPLPR